MNYAMIKPDQYKSVLSNHCAQVVNVFDISSRKNFDLPKDVKKSLIGAVVCWQDYDPLSLEDDMMINYFFDTKTNATQDLRLAQNGLYDAAKFASLRFQWWIEIVNYYTKPNRAAGEKPHEERHGFAYTGKVYPMGEKIKLERDTFFFKKNLEFALVPDDHKNKKVYEKTVFTATVLGTVI